MRAVGESLSTCMGMDVVSIIRNPPQAHLKFYLFLVTLIILVQNMFKSIPTLQGVFL